MLAGGLPADRSTLAVGGPGTGKSTLAMQFLQTGLDRGERCLFISTEQTPAELRDTFAGFAFDLDHDDLAIVTVHAALGRTVDDDEELTIKTLEGGELIDTGFGIPFESQYLRHALDQYGPVDRVVLDSASGLAAVSDDEAVFRRTVLDLIRLFSDDFGATSLIVAEGRPGDPTTLVGHESLQFATHGVIRLWRTEKRGSGYRFIRVEKMRGVDHDTRKYTVDITADGVRVTPRRRTRPTLFHDRGSLPTGVGGLDELLGGGLLQDENTLVLHDGRADVQTLLARVVASGIADDWCTSFTLPAEMSETRLNDFWAADPFTVDEALDDGRLQLLEYVRNPRDHHDNVLVYDEYGDVNAFIRDAAGNAGDRPHLAIVDLEPVLQRLGVDEIKQAAYQYHADMMNEDDVTVYVLNPNTVGDTFSSFLVDASSTVLNLWQDDDGLEYLHLEKNQLGSPGRGHIIEYLDDHPFVRLG